ncbi:hypothetical protein OEZ85_007832 [Tetradesmus obliquus]|uniref:Transcription factor TFIIIB component B'' Myb domain-containing protein n=1 Tax=Tetradesmus obliquus TaxID=3088 RepID=A0ABY8TJ24_TETOB|nr:hypothetical protein OEZ85_007832 [Tetradesmus obliquus]
MRAADEAAAAAAEAAGAVHGVGEGALVLVPQDPASVAAAQQRLLYRKGRGKTIINIEEPIDMEHWSIRNIAKRASAWDRQQEEAKRRDAKKRAQEAAAAAAAAEGEEPDAGAGGAAAAAGGSGAAGPGAIALINSGRQGSGQLSQQQQQQQQAAARSPAAAAATAAGGRSGGGGPGSMAPQLRIAEDGSVILDEGSLVVQAQQADLASFRRVDEGSRYLNSMTYLNRRSNDRWTSSDTELFYKALTIFGTDFTAIAKLFPGRDRRHMKTKFNKESRLHLVRINKAMAGNDLDAQEMADLSAAVQAAVDNENEAEDEPAAAAAGGGSAASGGAASGGGEASGDVRQGSGGSQGQAGERERAGSREGSVGRQQQQQQGRDGGAEEDEGEEAAAAAADVGQHEDGYGAEPGYGYDDDEYSVGW